jgi:methyl-accepting chemotaxis protein
MRDLPDDARPEPAGVFNPNAAIVQAIREHYAFIEFEPDGTIIGANRPFLAAVGYSLDEIAGRHHRIFMPPEEVETPAYREFWNRIGRGESFAGTFRRRRKDGTDIFILASYAPLFDRDGRMRRAFKMAVDVTEEKKLHNALGSALAELARGNLDCRIPGDFTGDKLVTRDAFNTTLDRLQSVFNGMARGTAGLGQLAGGLTSRAGELNDRAGSLAASIDQSSRAIRSLTTALSGVSEQATESKGVARAAAERAEVGQQTVAAVITAMKAIETITGEISKITKVIEGFAFQTNLLSINAAVEAARAGEAGKGFAVVATEVRDLSNRSAKASREIADLIKRGETEVATGVAQVGKAGSALDEITAAVSEMVGRVSGIAQELSGQARSVAEVQGALGAMERETGHLAAMAEKNGAAAGELSARIKALDGGINRFLSGG